MKKLKIGCSIAFGLFALPWVIIGVAALFNGRTGTETDLSQSILLADPPASLSEPVTLTLVTYNIQDLWVVGSNRVARMKALGEKLAELDPDIVGFQEAFIDEERQVLIEALSKSRLKHHQYFKSATVGSGLLIASAFPIKEAFFHRYSVAGDWYKMWEGDWWAGKGVGLARIELPGGKGLVDFYTTHAQAGYGNPDYREVRKQQMAECARFIGESRAKNGVAFITGDFNCRSGEEDYETVIAGAHLIRVMNVPSSIDHIFAPETAGYRFETLESLEIVEHAGIRLSDHNGYLSVVRVLPVAEPSTSALSASIS